jgi:prefoldin beta subunit
MKELSPQLQAQLASFRQLQQQLQVISGQRIQMEAKLKEIEGTLEELTNAGEDTPIYKSIGVLLIRAKDRAEVQKELEDQKETLSIRVKTLEKQEKSLAERYERMQQQLTAALGGQQSAQAG